MTAAIGADDPAMRPLTSLVRRADPDDPLAQVVRALLDSGLIVTTRDGAGRYVQLSNIYGRGLGIEGLESRGKVIAEGVELLDAAGNVVPRMAHPSQVARLSGEPQRLALGGARAANGHEMWMLNSFIPLDRDEDGWQVLTVGVPLPRSVFNPPTAFQQDAAPFQRALLDFALAVAGTRLDQAQLARAMEPAVRAILDEPLSASLTMVRDGWVYVEPIARSTSLFPPAPLRLSEESALRWRMTETYYNPSMGGAEVLGDRVVIEFPCAIRTYALVPMMDGHGRRVGAIGTTAPVPHALSPGQIGALEHLARLAGPVLVVPQDCGGASPA